ncbi:hypothetical protein [Colwellia sp. PAMC 20917]|uniref:hypothetical protein n=1 Tax=Colwellia sp. PAMC 20917 TaxID=1816218 RepID=UPI0018D2B8F9|nr:hypothetical protein [Colwellia sp. PAMC 20917]
MTLLIKGPTGCGKTRFIAHMPEKLNKPPLYCFLIKEPGIDPHLALKLVELAQAFW